MLHKSSFYVYKKPLNIPCMQTPSIKPHHWQTKLSQLAIIDLLAATGLESQSNFNILQNVKKKQPKSP